MILPQKLSNSLGVRSRYELFPMIQKKCILFCLQNGFLQSVCRIFFCIKSRLSRSNFCPVWWSPFAAVSRQGKNGTSLPCSRSSLLCVVFRSPPLPLCSRQFLQEEKTSRSQAAAAGSLLLWLSATAAWCFDHLKCDRITTGIIQLYYLSQNVFFTMHPRSVSRLPVSRMGGYPPGKFRMMFYPGNGITYPQKWKRQLKFN